MWLGYTYDVMLLLSSSFQVKFCENFTNEDNFNNTFLIIKAITHATAINNRYKSNEKV